MLLLGAYPHHLGGDVMLGVFLSEHSGAHPDLAVMSGGYPPYKFDFRADAGSCGYRMGGQHDGDRHVLGCKADDVDTLWRAVGNAVQWRRNCAGAVVLDLPVPLSVNRTRRIDYSAMPAV